MLCFLLVALLYLMVYNENMLQYLQIFKRHFLTPIFMIIACLAAVLLFLGEKQDAWFLLSVVLINIIFGMVQEIRAHMALRKIELLSKPKLRVRRAGQVLELDYHEARVGDVLLVAIGDEIAVDGQILKATDLECDESILTGEARPVKKLKADPVYASSLVVAGQAEILVEAVGDDTKTGQMAKKLKNYQPQITPLQKMLTKTIQYLTMLALVLATIFYVVYHFNQVALTDTVKTIVTAAVTVVPEGLLLASTVFLAYGSLKLTQARVLPQKLSAIESMALLDVLCVDKTGTLTSPEITFNQCHFFEDYPQQTQRNYHKLLGVLGRETASPNQTSLALAEAMPKLTDYRVLDSLAFSSTKKMSGIAIAKGELQYRIVLGAPEFMTELAQLSADQQQLLNDLNQQGLRTLLLAELPADGSFDQLDRLRARPIAFVTLTNYLRDGVVETIDYLQDNNIAIKVISGDNPATVAFIAKQAGILHPERIITGQELEELNETEWTKTVLETTIFGRVLPHQKEKIIATFKAQGLHTGMVGDGVNDALALKQSDLGVAMYAGAAATRRISDIVLLNNSFNSLPAGMKLGNQIIQSIELIACLFFHKIVFGVTLSLLTLLTGVLYPFAPRHITFMNIFLVTLPTVVFTLFPPQPRQRLNPKYFWRDTLLTVAPLGVLSGLAIFISYVLLLTLAPDSNGQATMVVIVATFFGMFLVKLINVIFDTRQTETSRLAGLVYVVSASAVALISFGFRLTRNFFNFNQPDFWSSLVVVAVVALVASLQYRLAISYRRRRQRA